MLVVGIGQRVVVRPLPRRAPACAHAGRALRCLGGNITWSASRAWPGTVAKDRRSEGIASSWSSRAQGEGSTSPEPQSRARRSTPTFKVVADALVESPASPTLLHAVAIDAVMTRRHHRVIVHSKSGRGAILARRVIELLATPTCVYTGAPFHLSRKRRCSGHGMFSSAASIGAASSLRRRQPVDVQGLGLTGHPEWCKEDDLFSPYLDKPFHALARGLSHRGSRASEASSTTCAPGALRRFHRHLPRVHRGYRRAGAATTGRYFHFPRRAGAPAGGQLLWRAAASRRCDLACLGAQHDVRARSPARAQAWPPRSRSRRTCACATSASGAAGGALPPGARIA